ncbi:acylphosphatase [Halomonas sp. V046]|uniref:acylphosphatase n=1 Tax=Halomonas sp. V046 TaxID=3459611 RepID=UPI0040449C7A
MSADDSVCVKALVSGQVQGVGYRWSTEQRALAAGLTGHAFNLPDGRVEVLLCGAPRAVKEVVQWLHQGPEHAHVSDVAVRDLVPPTWPQAFRTG